MGELYSTSQVAQMLGIEEWKVRRLFEDHTLPEPPRISGRRLISQRYIQTIRRACQARRWLEESTAGV
jgi:hypothetical protein